MTLDESTDPAADPSRTPTPLEFRPSPADLTCLGSSSWGVALWAIPELMHYRGLRPNWVVSLATATIHSYADRDDTIGGHMAEAVGHLLVLHDDGHRAKADLRVAGAADESLNDGDAIRVPGAHYAEGT